MTEIFYDRSRKPYLKNFKVPLFRYAKRIQNLENDRQLRRSMRKYVGQCDLELTQLLTSRNLKDFEKSVLRRLPKSESLKIAMGILETLYYTLNQLIPEISVLLRPALLDQNFSEGLVFRVVQKFQSKSKSTLADDTRVLAEGGEYSVLETQGKHPIKGYGMDFLTESFCDAKEILPSISTSIKHPMILLVADRTDHLSLLYTIQALERDNIAFKICDPDEGT